MRRESTTYSGAHQDTDNTEPIARPAARRARVALREAARLLALMLLGALLLALAYQIPVAHPVDIGGYDAAYVQGFFDPERTTSAAQRPDLAGSDGSARWTRATSYVLFPQAGLPAQVTLRLRGWRPGGAPPRFSVWLNGDRALGQFQASRDWQDYTFVIEGGLLKPNDVVLEIRSETARLDPGDPRAVGVLLDRARYQAGPAPIRPYPSQLLYGALAAGLLYTLLRRAASLRGGAQVVVGGWRALIGCLLVLSVAFLVLYRAQPLYPHPLLRLLPAIDAMLAALLALRYGPALARRAPVLLDAAAIGVIAAWAVALLLAARDHVTLSLPGVEKDFRVFALRSGHLFGQFPAGTTNPELDGVVRADGFYNLGYPLLLWLVRPLTHDNPFLAARLIAACSGALLLGTTWLLARRRLGRAPALLALLVLALSPLVVEGALYVGTDMQFAALCMLAVALLVGTDGERPTTNADMRSGAAEGTSPGEAPYRREGRRQHWLIIAAGLAAGAAFLVRHPGLLLLPFGWCAIWRGYGVEDVSYAVHPHERAQRNARNSKAITRHILCFTLAFLLAIAPQVAVNVRDTGRPLYSQQAKNVWQAVFGAGDWGRWGESANDISLGQVIAQDPGRFLANWWANMRGYFGTGGEDTREFGQAVQLRLLGFPANWLAVVGLLGWLLRSVRRTRAADTVARRQGDRATDSALSLSPPQAVSVSLLLWGALYVAAISVGLALQPRFALPLAPIYAIAAAWAVGSVRPASSRAALLAGMVLLALLWGGFRTGADYVLRLRPPDEAAMARAENRAELAGQPADEVGIIRLAQTTLRPGERLVVRVEPGVPIGKYSAIAHLVVPGPSENTPQALRASGAQYLVWSATLGPAPDVGAAVGTIGSYTLYRMGA